MPLSVTSTRTKLPSFRAEIFSIPPKGIASTAFVASAITACCNWPASPKTGCRLDEVDLNVDVFTATLVGQQTSSGADHFVQIKGTCCAARVRLSPASHS